MIIRDYVGSAIVIVSIVAFGYFTNWYTAVCLFAFVAGNNMEQAQRRRIEALVGLILRKSSKRSVSEKF